jgi:hypothetical protein
VQTFLPYPNILLSAKCLDYRRLGKQRVEAKQILNILTGVAKPNKNGKIAWENHPAVKMWQGYEPYLALYMNLIIIEWKSREYKNSMELMYLPNIIVPWWMGDNRLHSSHRANLLRKDYEYYSKFGWAEDPKTEYFWPTQIRDRSVD